MSTPAVPASTTTPSYTWVNWRKSLTGVPAQNTGEAMLFTDTWITGEIPKLGPFAFINTIAHADGRSGKLIRPAIAMRVTHHFVDEPNRPPIPIENDFEHYHGGDYLDEMAAIASLFLGVRLKAGRANRHFQQNGDPLGRPTQYGSKPEPQLLFDGRPQIPRLALSVNLNIGLQDLSDFPNRTVTQTNALIKSARQYQQAVWIADSDPALAWLMLVSAIETAAGQWRANITPIEQLETAHPEIVKIIRESKSPEILEAIAERLKNITRSTKRFVEFIDTFAPQPPVTRPESYLQISYEKTDLKKAVRLIYGHRSKSLHGGTAFPEPMCEQPRADVIGEGLIAVQEKPMGLATATKNASWRIENTPMLLNAFEHIARGALLNWWKSTANSNP